MGALCSKSIDGDNKNEVGNPYAASGSLHSSEQSDLSATPMRRSTKKRTQDHPDQLQEERVSAPQIHRKGSRNNSDYFYDGIPRVPAALSQKSRSMKSNQAAVGKVSEVSFLLGKASSVGLGKAVEVLDVLGSSMTDFNSRSGFVSGAASRGTKVSILAFEVANTIMKGCKLVNSLEETRIAHLKEVVLPSQGVQNLISKDMDELLQIVAHDKREELELFQAEVVRFGNRCKDPQWHNLERYFQKQNLELNTQNQLMDEMESMMNQLTALVQSTSELYHELHSLDQFDQEYHCEDTGLRAEIKRQRKLVKNLKKRSLWSRSLEEVMEKLVDVVLFVHLRIHDGFNTDGQNDGTEEQLEASEASACEYQRLGPAGLALHYANMILQIDGIVARSSSMTLTTRDSLYQSLPPSIKSTLRSKLQTFQVKEEISIQEIKTEMEKTLHWLVPMATNTVKSHHGFGWVGEWANAGLDSNRATSTQNELVRIDTLYHADKAKTEAHIADQLLWLHHLIQKSRASNVRAPMIRPLKPCTLSTLQSNENEHPKAEELTAPSPLLTTDDQQMLLAASKGKESPERSTTDDSDTDKESPSRENERPNKSSDQSPSRESKDLVPVVAQSHLSGLCTADFSMDSVDTVHVIG